MKNPLTNRSIARKLQLSVGLATGLVLTLTVWTNFNANRIQLEEKTNVRAIAGIRAASNRLDDFIERIGMIPRTNALRQEAFGPTPDPGLPAAMSYALGQLPKEEVYGIYMAYEKMAASDPASIPGVDRRSWPANAPVIYDFHDPAQEWYRGAKESGTFHVTEPYFDDGGSNIAMLSLTQPVHGPGNEFIGVAGVDLALDSIRDLVRAVHLEVRGGSEDPEVSPEFAYLVSRGGKIISHPDESLMLHKGFKGEDVTSRPGGTAIASKPEGFELISVRGESRRVYWAQSPLTGWKIVLNISNTTVLEPVRQLAGKSILIGTLGLLAMIGVITLLARRLAKPLEILHETSAAIEQGNFRAELLGKLPQRRDEFGELARGFEKMAAEIRVREQRLEEWNQNLERTVEQRTDERQQAEAGLTESRATMAALISSIPDQIFYKNPDGVYLGCNEAFATRVGKPVGEITGKTDYDLFPQGAADAFRAGDLEMLRTLERRSNEEWVTFPDGRQVLLDTLKAPFWDSSEKLLGILGISRDITERDRMRSDLVAAKVKAEDATEAKSMFLANMSHEIRTPMNAIIGLSHLALKTELTPKQRDYVSKVHNAGTSLLAIINDILDFSKIEAGKLDIETTDFQIDEVLGSVTTLTAQKAHEKGIEFLADVTSEIPRFLRGDPLRLGQILTNLVNNAVKFTERGEIRLGIGLAEHTGGKVQLKFSVRDTGMGMTREQAGKLFQPFAQADMSTTRKHGGTGLGLTICRRLVELMGGQIWLESEPGVGSTFFFTVWLGVGSSAGQQILPAQLPKLHVLVVDDNPAAREILADALKDVTDHVDVVGSGSEAVSAVQQHDATFPYDLVFMDWRMPGMDGMEATRRIKQDTSLGSQPAVVMVTAFGRDEVREESEQLGIDGFLVKPVTRSLLVDTIVTLFAPASGETSHASADDRHANRLAGARILLAEDNEINQQIAVELLEGIGATITVANNGREALDHLLRDSTAFDLVLMDLQMPVMGGYEATLKIRSQEALAKIPIIAMTAHATIEEKQKCLEAGMNGHISKPIDPNLLFETVGRFYQPKPEAITAAVVLQRADAEDLPEIDGLDSRDGLARVAGNRKLYLKLLRQFAVQQGRAVAEITVALDQGDPQLAERIAHTLKGVAANLGAKRVQSAASSLEEIIRHRGNAAETIPALKQVAAVLDPLIDGLKSFLPAPESIKPETALAPVDPAETRAAAVELGKLLADFDSAAGEFIGSHRAALFPLFPGDGWTEFVQLVENYDFSGAEARLTQALGDFTTS